MILSLVFQVLTILTTAGFATDDFNLWSDNAKVIQLVLMFIGGCAGSAGGGRSPEGMALTSWELQLESAETAVTR